MSGLSKYTLHGRKAIGVAMTKAISGYENKTKLQIISIVIIVVIVIVIISIIIIIIIIITIFSYASDHLYNTCALLNMRYTCSQQ